MRTAVDTFFKRRLIAAALLLALPLAALADPGHVHELTPASADTLTVVGPWELTGIEPSRSGFMFTRMEVTQTLLDEGCDVAICGRTPESITSTVEKRGPIAWPGGILDRTKSAMSAARAISTKASCCNDAVNC